MKNKPLTISLTLVSLTIAFLGLFTACSGNGDPMKTVSGSGNVITEERPVSGFTAVLLQGVGQVVIDQTDKESLSITADDNLLPYIETSVQEDKLIISVKGNTLFNHVTELTYHVTVESIDSVELDGAGSIEVSHLDTDDFQVNLNGAGNIAVFGRADKQTVEIDGAGAYIAEDLVSQEATVRHRGAGVAVVNVSDQLDVRIDGLGTVDYIGDPDVTQKINGTGAVQQR